MLEEKLADGFCVAVDTLDPRDRVAAVALQEEGVFAPEVVFIVGIQLLF